MRNKQFLNYFIFIFFLLFLPLLVNRSVGAETDDTEAVSGGYAPQWATPHVAITTETTAPDGAAQAVVAVAPNGTVMVAFDRKGSNKNPYYTASTDNGTTWAAIKPIYTTGNSSADINIAYDNGNQAHATWVEDENQIFYLRQSGGNWQSSSLRTISQPAQTPDPTDFVSRPQIFITGSATIDVVWIQKITQLTPGSPFESPGVKIYHARSTDNGGSWSTASVIDEDVSSDSATPSLFVQGNTIHVVRALLTADSFPTSQDVYYTVSTDGGANWSNKKNIADFDNDNEDDGDPTDGRSPNITINNNTIHVSFVELQAGNVEQQFVHHVSCSLSNDCTNISNWSADGSISGQKLGANNSAPYNVLAGMTTINNCTLIYFHGTINSPALVNEQLFGTSSCGSGAWGDRETVTSTNLQTLRPHLATHNDWWVYMVYEQVDTTSQIYFLRNKPALYLPLIQKN